MSKKSEVHRHDAELIELIEEHEAAKLAAYTYPTPVVALPPIEDDLTVDEREIYELVWGAEEVAA